MQSKQDLAQQKKREREEERKLMISKLLETKLNTVIKRQPSQDCDYPGLDIFPKMYPSPSILLPFPYHFHGIFYSAAISSTFSPCLGLMSSNPPSISKDQDSCKTNKTSQLASCHFLRLSSTLCICFKLNKPHTRATNCRKTSWHWA